MTYTDPKDIQTPVNLEEFEEESRQSSKDARRQPGFLPIETNWFDRLFISVVIWVALSLVWLRFLEPAGLPLMISNAISIAIAITIIWKG
ncbi:hypothetical protein FP2506_11897 [Fulvimarina pelagi HTCC2506]|uniref:Uncharacterized protein n=1 Tax=Fulvimarina pelagi HTCC2506 TaxID=314231 RepID=Q0FYQ0_9HYPH|nr:DUF2160 family membrane protein [Fulvimarina pelagi]EAU40258.1 hypothetical protein FP2506_11897 [Fulvimarina pelagi HTCC2506]